MKKTTAMNTEASSIPASPVSQPDVSYAPMPRLDISHHVTEELVPVPTPVDNAPPALDTATPARSGIFARIFGSNGPQQQEERNITARRRAVGPDAVPASPREDQQLLQLQLSAAAAEQRMVTFRMETEIAELDARKAAAEAARTQSQQRTHALERESAGNFGASLSPSPPRERRSSRRSPSPPSEVAALLQLLQQQQQQAADREQRHEEQRREDRREAEAQRREDRREAAEREARLEARLLQTPTTASC